MNHCKFTMVLALAGAFVSPTAFLGQEGADWIPLFNGKDLSGWRQLNGWALYEIEDGAIVGTTAEGSPNSFLCTEKLYSDFELEFEVQVDPRLNSGVQIRSNSFPEYRMGRVHGYQVEIASNDSAGFIYDEARRGGWLDRDRSESRARGAFRKDQWNKFRVVCWKDSIQTWVNGVPVADVVDSLTRTGHIGLQVHSFRGDSPAQVRWRNIRIRELGPLQEEPKFTPGENVQAVIDQVEKLCRDRRIPMIGRKKAERLAELVRRARPQLVVECGTAIGYSGLWIARELKAAGQGKLVTMEIDPARAREAEGYLEKAGLMDIVQVQVGDARELVKTIKGKVDFLFLDCGYQNYHPCFRELEKKLREGAVVIADNVGIGAGGMKDFLELVRSKYRSRTEWFEINLPWVKRDAMEVTVVAKQYPHDRRMEAVIDAVEKECLTGPPYIYTIGRLRGERLAGLIREAKPGLVVECGTAIGYSGLWIARELKAAGRGKLITFEIDPNLAKKAEANFRRAGLDELVAIRIGDARKLVREVEGVVDFAFIDCNAPNYLPCFQGLERKLKPGALVVADNVAVSERQLGDYLELVRTKHQSRIEWFDVNQPWGKRDAMEITIIKKFE